MLHVDCRVQETHVVRCCIFFIQTHTHSVSSLSFFFVCGVMLSVSIYDKYTTRCVIYCCCCLLYCIWANWPMSYMTVVLRRRGIVVLCTCSLLTQLVFFFKKTSSLGLSHSHSHSLTNNKQTRYKKWKKKQLIQFLKDTTYIYLNIHFFWNKIFIPRYIQ